MATAGRHTLCERAVSMFLQQDYQNKHLLIWQNSPVYKTLPKDYSNITLVNNHLNRQTGERYATLGEIYNDILDYVFFSPDAPKYINADIICHWDDDDAYLGDHISKGVDGYIKGGKKAYKPERSYYAHANGIDLVGNNMEPSIFVSANHLFVHGYSNESVAHHLKWLNPLLTDQQIHIDPKGKPTMIYDWSPNEVGCYKTSGNPSSPTNFDDYHRFSQDHGDCAILPWDKNELDLEFKRMFNNA